MGSRAPGFHFFVHFSVHPSTDFAVWWRYFLRFFSLSFSTGARQRSDRFFTPRRSCDVSAGASFWSGPKKSITKVRCLHRARFSPIEILQCAGIRAPERPYRRAKDKSFAVEKALRRQYFLSWRLLCWKHDREKRKF